MKIRTGRPVVAALAVASLLVAACNGASATTTPTSAPSVAPTAAPASAVATASGSTPAASASYKIGVLFPTLNNPFFVDMENGANQAAKDLGATVLDVSANNDVSTQTKQVEDFIAQGVNALVIQAVDTKGILGALGEANTAKIPVFTPGEAVTGANVVTAVVFNEVQDGVVDGQYVAQHVKPGAKIVELLGIQGTQTALDRQTGFEQALTSGCPTCVIVAKQPANYDRNKALSVMAAILQAQPHIDAVYAANDEMALGAIKAIQEASRQKEMFVVGNDGEADAIAAVKDGTLTATNGIPAFVQGYAAVATAIKSLQGTKVCSQILEKSVLITKDNVAQADQLMHNMSDRYWESCWQ